MLALFGLLACSVPEDDECTPMWVDSGPCTIWWCWMEEPDGNMGTYYAWDRADDGTFGHHTDVCTNTDCVQLAYEDAAAEACDVQTGES